MASLNLFFGQPSNQLQSHLWSLGLPSVLAKTSQKAFSACKIVGGGLLRQGNPQ